MKRSWIKRGNSKLKKKSKNPIKGLRDKADRALQDFYRATFPFAKCESCGAQFQLMHHFVPKSQSNYLRYREVNLIFLCHRCHFLHHNVGNPLIHGRIIQGRGIKWFEEIEVAKLLQISPYGKKDLEQIIEKYGI